MLDYFVDHALKNVWCMSSTDTQVIVQPAKLTAFGGVWNTVDVLWQTHTLPLPSVRFHVYQIGQLNPALMGLFPVDDVWTTFSTACNNGKTTINLYTNSGVQLPRTETWYKVTSDRNLIIAVKEQPRIPIDLNTETIFLRVYNNPFFHSEQFTQSSQAIVVSGGTQTSTDTILALQLSYNAFLAKSGQTCAFVNGFKVAGINLLTVQPGDIAEYIYDSSVYKVVKFPVSALPTFTSALDNKFKYLLHYNDTSENIIDYQEDLDMYVVHPGLNGQYSGVYYHRNQADAMRMLTHKDYSIPVSYLIGYASDQLTWTDPTQLVLELHIRKSGYARPLVNETNRIKELYKLADTDISTALIGVAATVPNWTAAFLEASNYVKIMRSTLTAVTPIMVQNAYGYNAISKLLADTPSFVTSASGQLVVAVPYGIQNTFTAYEYDSLGILLGGYPDSNVSQYIAVNSNTILIELISGNGGLLLDERYGETTTALNVKTDYRMYTCPIRDGVPTNIWADVTNTDAYTSTATLLTWLVDASKFYTLVRSNRNTLLYSLLLTPSDGVLKFSLAHQQTRAGITSNWTMQVPMGELDVFLNGRSLIENLDYFVVFPQIVIVNKEYLKGLPTTNQAIVVRFSGFCNTDFTRTKSTDTGFIKYGLLSDNNRFDIRDDKVMRIVVDGRVYDRSQLQFAEGNSGIGAANVPNGRPYQLRDIVVPLQNYVPGDTYGLRKLSLVVDRQVSDYLTLKVPNPVFTIPNAIAERYQVFSPFCCKIIYDLKSGLIPLASLQVFYNDDKVRTLCQPYEYLLKFDPTQQELRPDEQYVEVQPHFNNDPINLNIYCYKFLTRVVNLYLHDRVNLSHFVTITATI